MRSTPTRTPEEIQAMLPLLLSIAGEVRERTRDSGRLRARIDVLERRPKANRRRLDELWARYAAHQRELRGVEKELGRLGCTTDAEWPWHVTLCTPERGVVYEGALDRTQFFLRPARPFRRPARPAGE